MVALAGMIPDYSKEVTNDPTTQQGHTTLPSGKTFLRLLDRLLLTLGPAGVTSAFHLSFNLPTTQKRLYSLSTYSVVATPEKTLPRPDSSPNGCHSSHVHHKTC